MTDPSAMAERIEEMREEARAELEKAEALVVTWRQTLDAFSPNRRRITVPAASYGVSDRSQARASAGSSARSSSRHAASVESGGSMCKRSGSPRHRRQFLSTPLEI